MDKNRKGAGEKKKHPRKAGAERRGRVLQNDVFEKKLIVIEFFHKIAADKADVKVKTKYFKKLSGDFAVIGDNLFGYGGKKFTSDGSVSLTCAPLADSEIRQVARVIKQAVSGGEYRYRDMAVVCCDRTEYRGVVEKVFAAERMPVAEVREADYETLCAPSAEEEK